MANGRIVTGFSKPYVALYSASGSTVTYSSGMALARGVSVSLDVESSDDNDFYADNVVAESASGVFGGGSLTLGVDGLKKAAAKLIEGTGTQSTVTVGTSTVNVTDYNDSQEVPYVGVGCIVRYMEDGIASYEPILFTKVKFAPTGLSATTQGESIDWQSAELTAKIFRDDTTAHNWKRVADAQTSEEAAEDVLKAFLSITE